MSRYHCMSKREMSLCDCTERPMCIPPTFSPPNCNCTAAVLPHTPTVPLTVPLPPPTDCNRPQQLQWPPTNL